MFAAEAMIMRDTWSQFYVDRILAREAGHVDVGRYVGRHRRASWRLVRPKHARDARYQEATEALAS